LLYFSALKLLIKTKTSATVVETGVKVSFIIPITPRDPSAWMRLLLIGIERSASAPTSPLVKKIKQLVNEDIRRNNIEIARIMNYHPYYLDEVFTRAESISLCKYIMKE